MAKPGTTHKEERTNIMDTNSATAQDTANFVTIEIADLQITLPVKFTAGYVLTDNQAKILDAAYQRQFTNNQNANAKSRAEKLAKATTDEERASCAPLTAAQIAALYTAYEPAVGGTPRASALETMRLAAGWRATVALFTEHNDSVKRGGPPIVTKAGMRQLVLPTGKIKAANGQPEVSLEDQRKAFAMAMLSKPGYADRVQQQLDAIMAEKGSKPAVQSENVVALGADDF